MPHLLINTRHFYSFQSRFVFLEKMHFISHIMWRGVERLVRKRKLFCKCFWKHKVGFKYIEEYFIPLMLCTLLRIHPGYLNPGEGNELECLLPKPLSCFPFCCRTPWVSFALLPVLVENSALFAVGNVLVKLWWSRALCGISESILNACSYSAGWWWWFLCLTWCKKKLLFGHLFGMSCG